MHDYEARTETMTVSDARREWDEVLSRVSRERMRVILDADGTPVAAIVPPTDLERLRQLELRRTRDFAILDEIGSAFEDVPADELEREVARAIREVREEQRRQQPTDAAAS
jgi:prevent-host-death family protein